jgi:hypothetical protein
MLLPTHLIVKQKKYTAGPPVATSEFGKPEYGSHTIENLASDLGISQTTIKYEIQFAKRYPEFVNALTNLPWRQAIKMLSGKTNEGKDKAPSCCNTLAANCPKSSQRDK